MNPEMGYKLQSNSSDLVSPERPADHRLSAKGAYEHRQISVDLLLSVACFHRGSQL
jgi:hypothetical protein